METLNNPTGLRDERLAFSKALFNFYHKDPNTRNLTDSEKKKRVSEMLVEHFRDERLIDFFKNPRSPESYKSVLTQDDEIKQTIQAVNGLKGYQESQSNLPYEIWLQTQTPTYKINFGESAPNILYHGTNNHFTPFDDKMIKHEGRSNDMNNFGNGHYFTPNKDFANSYVGSDGGEVKRVFVNVRNFADISEKYVSPEQDDIKKDHSYLLLASMVNQAIADNTPEKLERFDVYARSLALGDRAITDINKLQSLDPSIYQAVGFSGIQWHKFEGKDEIVAFSAKSIFNVISREQVDKIEQSLNIDKTYPGYKPLEQGSPSVSQHLDPKAHYEQLKKEVLAGKELNTEIKITDKGLDK